MSLVIPTYNEHRALQSLLPRLQSVRRKLSAPMEVIVVDDNSPDGTADFAQSFETDRLDSLRVVRRAGKYGQASAVIEGWRSARGSILGVMDADGAHDEGVLPEMLEAVLEGPAEVAVGSRFVREGGLGDETFFRKALSVAAALLAQPICPARDATSGFLLFRREVLEGVSLDPTGRIALEVLVRGRYRTFTEVPYVHKARSSGGGKVEVEEALAYFYQLVSLISYRYRHPHQRRRWMRVVS